MVGWFGLVWFGDFEVWFFGFFVLVGFFGWFVGCFLRINLVVLKIKHHADSPFKYKWACSHLLFSLLQFQAVMVTGGT